MRRAIGVYQVRALRRATGVKPVRAPRRAIGVLLVRACTARGAAYSGCARMPLPV